jgi:GT2 family glycosyltransferase
MIEIIAASRLTENEFWRQSPLGLSLVRLSFEKRLKPQIFFANNKGLPEIYNARIASPDGHDILVFIHDDVWIEDFFIADHVLQGLSQFEIIGVAGNRRRLPNQPAWAFSKVSDTGITWDASENLSGSVAHGPLPFGIISHYGPAPADCELLDGALLATRRSILQAKAVFFDPAFDFHFYDMDFCRTAKNKGLRLGTWHISITHRSGGSFCSPEWWMKYNKYISKWKS